MLLRTSRTLQKETTATHALQWIVDCWLLRYCAVNTASIQVREGVVYAMLSYLILKRLLMPIFPNFTQNHVICIKKSLLRPVFW